MRVYKFLNRKFGATALRNRRLKISELDKVNDPYELRPFKFTNPAYRMAIESTRHDQAKRFGIMCFSKHWKNPVIWSHYAESHIGLCLGFDIPDDGCREVTYVDELLTFNPPFDPKHPSAPAKTEHIHQMLFTKFVDWKYEEEIRMWVTTDERENGIPYYDFGDSLCLAEVIIGAGCDLKPECIQRLIGPYTLPVTILKARRSAAKFEMEVETEGHRRFDEQERWANRQVDELDHLSLKPEPRSMPGRNDPCWCGSGRKYKKCHGA